MVNQKGSKEGLPMSSKSMPVDLMAFYARTGISQRGLSEVLGLSIPSLWRYRKEGQAPRVVCWALNAVEAALAARGVVNATPRKGPAIGYREAEHA